MNHRTVVTQFSTFIITYWTSDIILALNIARGLAGDAMKRFILCIGAGNTGKSTLTQAIQHSCGGYFGTFNAGNLAYKDNNDEAQALRWLMLLTSKRIIVSNEIKTTHKLDSNAIINTIE